MNLGLYNIRKIKNGVTYNGNSIQIFDIQRRDNKMISRDDMMKLSNKLQADLRKLYSKGLISVSIQYPNRFFNGDVSTLQNDINFFTMDDYDEFDDDPNEYKSFRFTFIPITKLAKGGSDPHNDCLINCIKKVIQTHKNKIDAEELKEYLCLERNDKIPLSKLSLVEKYIEKKTNMDYAIYVSGDYEYISSLNTNKKIRLILSDEHYSLDKELISKKNIAFEEKKIVMYEWKGEIVNCFDGEKYFDLSRKEYDEIKSKPMSSDYLLVNKNYNNKAKKLTIEESYKSYIDMADEMKRETNGYINFYKCASVKDVALHHFYNLIKSVQPEPIYNNEAEFIDCASFGATTYYERYEGQVHSFDINSCYPYVISRNYNSFPIREGEYVTIKKIKEKPDYGIYRCIISNPENKIIKLFRFNPNSYYTHIDINLAKQYNLTVELIQDEQPNFLYYSKDKLINGKFLFGHYISDIYALKEKKIKGAKDLLNILYGALSEKNYNKFSIDSDTELNITNAKIVSMYSTDERIKLKVISYKYGWFKTNFARILPFVLALGRDRLYYVFKNYQNFIVRAHTDGVLLKEIPETLLTGTKLGQLKHDGTFNVNITKLNKIGKTI
jgi:hypothetical protein